MRAVSNSERINKLVLAIVLATMLLPLGLSFLNISEKPLNGSFFNEPDVSFSWQSWFSGDYQEQKDKFLSHHFGLHNTYVKINNQIEFSLFKKPHAKFVVIGKENYLYEMSYIDAYFGKDYKGQPWISDQVKKLKCVQDSMTHRNKLLCVVFAPGKASFYPEFIPEKFKRKNAHTNYGTFVSVAQQQNLNHIDFNQYFVTQRSKSSYPLYPQFGIHWSNYGALLAIDSVVRYAEKHLGYDLADVVHIKTEFSDSLRPPDDDVLKGMNLLIEPQTFPMAYSSYSVTYDSTKHRKPNLLVIADSFWWYIYSTGIPGSVFSENRFWYYNEEMYPESFTGPYYVNAVNYYERIRHADIILILYSESNLYKFGNGFADMCYEAYCKKDPKKEELQKIKGDIRASPEWYSQIVKKAQENNIPVDSMLTRDALFIMERAKKGNTSENH